ncbi:MAG: hypothetical protein P8H03_03335 [Emcibacteraceae bacterium]|nr:hypothetical protein [Emcibacteraceae bacterium]
MLNDSEMHPDYFELAIDLSKLFRLDSIGIDIITPDISLSWREAGVILEMNAHPGLDIDPIDKMLDNYFSDNQGRIDTTLVVSNNHKYSENIFNKKHKKFSRVGLANNQAASFKTGKLMVVEKGLLHNCLALLLNNSCDAIVVSISPEEITKSGLPIDYFDHCIIDPECSVDIENTNNVVQKLTDAKDLTDWLSKFTGQIQVGN